MGNTHLRGDIKKSVQVKEAEELMRGRESGQTP